MSKELKIASALAAFSGILFLIAPGLVYLGTLINKSLTALISTIGDVLLKTSETLSPLVVAAIISFIIAGIFWLGTFLKDENDQESYLILTITTWVTWGFALLGMAMNTTPIPLIVGFGFMGLIAPPFVYLIAKGIIRLLDDKIQQ
jgi:apolipoprotein N-acyltransferase